MSAIKWSETNTIEFIENYINEECLWNVTCNDYKNRQRREAAYKRLQESVTFLSSFTIQDVKNKIKNIRSTYYQELKKIKSSMGTDSGVEMIYKPNVKWFDTLHAVMQMVTSTRRTVSNDSNMENTDHEENSEQTEMENVKSTNNIEPLTEISHVFKTTDVGTRKRKKYDRIATVSNDIKELKKLKSATPANHIHDFLEDEFHFFGMNVASQLRKMPLQNSLRLQTKIQTLLAEERISLMQHNNTRVSREGTDYIHLPSPCSSSGSYNNSLNSYQMINIKEDQLDTIIEASRSISSHDNYDDDAVGYSHL